MNQSDKSSLSNRRNSSAKLSQATTLLLPALRDLAMPQLQIKFAYDSRKRQRSGMTLIELLVAVSILVIIAAILVPQLRFASADRNIREASRTAASLFAQASQRAINDGEAGVVIERNPNIIDADTGIAYAGTSMFLLRKVPRFTGEDDMDVARAAADTAEADGFSDTEVLISLPLEQNALGIIRVGDQISFGDQRNKRFVITALSQPDTSTLQLTTQAASDFLENDFPNPPVTQDSSGNDEQILGSYTVYRQPRKLISSRVDMPTGYLVDLRLSGEMATATQTYFDQDDRSAGTAEIPNSIAYIFNGRGSIDRFFYTALVSGSYQRLFNIPNQPAYLMVREYSTDDGGERIANVLNSERNMWVTVEPVTGASNVVSGVPVDLGGGNLSVAALRAARTLSSQGQQAAQ